MTPDSADKLKGAVDSAAKLRPEEIDTIKVLKEDAPLSSIELAYKLALLPSEVNQYLEHLEKEGLVELDATPNEDAIAQEQGGLFTLSGEGQFAASVADFIE